MGIFGSGVSAPTGYVMPIEDNSDAPTIYNTTQVIKKPETYVAPSGVLTVVPAVVPTVRPNLGTPDIAIIPESKPELFRPPNVTDQAWSIMQRVGAEKLAAQAAQQALIDAEAAKITQELQSIIAENPMAAQEIAYQGTEKVAEQIQEVARVTVETAQEEAAAQVAAQVDALTAVDAVASLNYANQLAEAVKAQNNTATSDPNNVSAANAALVIADQTIRAAASAQLAAEDAISIATANPNNLELQKIAAEQAAAAALTEVVAAEVVAEALATKEIILDKVFTDAENTAMTLADKAAEPDATLDDKIAATKAAERLNEAEANVTTVQTEVSDAKQVATELVAKVESDAAEAKAILENPKVAELKRLGFLDQIVEFVYKSIYKN